MILILTLIIAQGIPFPDIFVYRLPSSRLNNLYEIRWTSSEISSQFEMIVIVNGIPQYTQLVPIDASRHGLHQFQLSPVTLTNQDTYQIECTTTRLVGTVITNSEILLINEPPVTLCPTDPSILFNPYPGSLLFPRLSSKDDFTSVILLDTLPHNITLYIHAIHDGFFNQDGFFNWGGITFDQIDIRSNSNINHHLTEIFIGFAPTFASLNAIETPNLDQFHGALLVYTDPPLTLDGIGYIMSVIPDDIETRGDVHPLRLDIPGDAARYAPWIAPDYTYLQIINMGPDQSVSLKVDGNTLFGNFMPFESTIFVQIPTNTKTTRITTTGENVKWSLIGFIGKNIIVQ